MRRNGFLIFAALASQSATATYGSHIDGAAGSGVTAGTAAAAGTMGKGFSGGAGGNNAAGGKNAAGGNNASGGTTGAPGTGDTGKGGCSCRMGSRASGLPDTAALALGVLLVLGARRRRRKL